MGVLGIEQWRMHTLAELRGSRREPGDGCGPRPRHAHRSPRSLHSVRSGEASRFCCECHVASVLRDVCVVHRGWRFVCTCVQQTRSTLRRSEETKAEVYEGT